MSKDDLVQLDGKVVDALDDGIGKIELDANEGVSPFDPTHATLLKK